MAEPLPVRDAGAAVGEEPPPAVRAALPRMATVEDVAAWLGIGDRAARKMMERGELPSFRLGRRLYVLVEDLEAAIVAKRDAARVLLATRARDGEAAADFADRMLRGSRPPVLTGARRKVS